MKHLVLSWIVVILLLCGCNTQQTNPTSVPESTDNDMVSNIETVENAPEEDRQTLCHILLLGQSLSLGYDASPCLPPADLEDTYMFRQVRTQDLGYALGITREEYQSDSGTYDVLFYDRLYPLAEKGGDGFTRYQWVQSTHGEYETPATGIAIGLHRAFQVKENCSTPWPLLFSAPGIGGTSIDQFLPGNPIFERTKADIQNGRRLATEHGMDYCVKAIVWIQGENDYLTPLEEYKGMLQSVVDEYSSLAAGITGQDEPPVFISYQTMGRKSYYPEVDQTPSLAQLYMAQFTDGFFLSSPCYSFELSNDRIHLTNVSSRDLGILLGHTLYEAIQGEYVLFVPSSVNVNGNLAELHFPFPIELSEKKLYTSHNRDKTLANKGFFCYNANGRQLDCSVLLTEDGLSLKILCNGDIYRITYGYDAAAPEGQRYTYGGMVCRADSISGVDGDIQLYMPIQNIYEKETPTG